MRDAPLESNLWYRVADLRPRLVARARLHRHLYRGRVWYLLQDPATGRVHRFTPAARLVLAAMDGQRSVRDLWAIAGSKLGDDAPTQDDLIPAAKAWIEANLDNEDAASQPWDRKGYKMPGGTPSTPSLAASLPSFPSLLRQQRKRAPMPAPREAQVPPP